VVNLKKNRIFYIYGNNDSYLDYKIKELFEEITKTNKNVDFFAYSCDELELETLETSLKSKNLFGNKEFIVIKKVESCRDDVKDLLLKHIEKDEIEQFLVLTSEKYPVKKFIDLIKEKGIIKQYKYANFNDISNIINVLFEDKKINKQKLKEVFELTGQNISRTKTEYIKIKEFLGDNSAISNEDIDMITKNIRTEESVFALTKKLNTGKSKEALILYRELLLTENVFMIFTIFVLNITRLYIVKKMINMNTSRKNISKITGIQDYFLDEYIAGVKEFTEKQLLGALNDLLTIEKLSKTGNFDMEIALEDFIIKRYHIGEVTV
jgi:DNA polymerase III delta subunit